MFFEHDGHSDAGAAWEAFARAWNWAAPLPTAAPAVHPRTVSAPTVRTVTGGFTLSGLWHLPAYGTDEHWLALPLDREGRAVDSTADGPDLFVVPSHVLPRPSGDRHGGDAETPGAAVRLDDLFVPTGFAAHSTGTPLRAEQAGFLWAAVTGMALGRRAA